LPLVESIQWVMVRTEVFGQTVPTDCPLEHTAERHSVNGATVNTKPNDTTRELVNHHENPMGSQRGRFATEQIAAPQTVLRLAEKGKPGRISRIRFRPVAQESATTSLSISTPKANEIC
jgi:hypothetical protein